jgi:HPt (histidine-containing phosphotransfer) domain-containing protein
MRMVQDPKEIQNSKRIQELLNIGGGCREFVAELLMEFHEQAPTLMEGMKKGCETGDARLAEQSAHKLKGSCRELGFEEVQQLCHQFERLCRVSDLPNASLLLLDIESSYPRVEIEINDFLKGHSA